jgi:hypothetical protein
MSYWVVNHKSRMGTVKGQIVVRAVNVLAAELKAAADAFTINESKGEYLDGKPCNDYRASDVLKMKRI